MRNGLNSVLERGGQNARPPTPRAAPGLAGGFAAGNGEIAPISNRGAWKPIRSAGAAADV